MYKHSCNYVIYCQKSFNLLLWLENLITSKMLPCTTWTHLCQDGNESILPEKSTLPW